MNDKNKPASLDRTKINGNEAYELTYWSDQFDVTKAKLKAAVNAVGPTVKDIEAYLKRSK